MHERERPLALLRRLEKKIDNFMINLEKMDLAEYMELRRSPLKMLYVNFISGIARGLGMAVGFTLLGALVIYILRQLVIFNLPLVSSFIAKIVNMVLQQTH